MVDNEPVMGVSVSVRVYGNVEMGDVTGCILEIVLEENDEGDWDRGSGGNDEVEVGYAAGKVVKRRPVERPTIEETGE